MGAFPLDPTWLQTSWEKKIMSFLDYFVAPYEFSGGRAMGLAR